jgi:hypothetical protein
LDDRCSIPGKGNDENISLRHGVQTGSELHAVCYSMDTGGLCNSLPSRNEVKNAWSYISTPQYVFIVWFLFKQRDSSRSRNRAFFIVVTSNLLLGLSSVV